MELDKVRILILGDSGVGKTSFVHLLCYGEPLQTPQWTVGCSVEMKLHAYRAGTAHEREYFMELWDVGGTPKYASTRSVFYTRAVSGVILVYDTTSQKSQSSLERWLSEVITTRNGNQQRDDDDVAFVTVAGANESTKSSVASSFSTRQSIGSALTSSATASNQLSNWTLPTLLVGTKLDNAEQRKLNASSSTGTQLGGRWTMGAQSKNDLRDTTAWPADRSHAARRLLQPLRAARFIDEINLSNLEARSLNPGSTNAVILSRFFDAAIETSMGGNANVSIATSSSFPSHAHSTADNSDLSSRAGNAHAGAWTNNLYSSFIR